MSTAPVPYPVDDRLSASDAAKQLKEQFGNSVSKAKKFRDEITIDVKLESLEEVLRHCKHELGFDLLVDICSVDHSGEADRFEMVYHLYSIRNVSDLRIKSRLPEDDPVAPTASFLWPTANWHEREVYDMMGITFSGHPDLRRILMWEGYPYFPLRKEFPLAGKESLVPDVAFTDPAPLAGGPFVTIPSDEGTISKEPRSRG